MFFSKSYPLSRFLCRFYQPLYCIKDDLKLMVIFLFHFLYLMFKVLMCGEHFPDFCKSSHYLDVDLYSPWELRTLDNMATPFSVKAYGSLRVPPQLDVPKWNIKFFNSS